MESYSSFSSTGNVGDYGEPDSSTDVPRPVDSEATRMKSLYQAVLVQAFRDAGPGASAGDADSPEERERARRDATRFLLSDVPVFRAHFELVCDFAGMDPANVRMNARRICAPQRAVSVEAGKREDAAADRRLDVRNRMRDFRAKVRARRIAAGTFDLEKSERLRNARAEMQAAIEKGPAAVTSLKISRKRRSRRYMKEWRKSHPDMRNRKIAVALYRAKIKAKAA